MSSVGETNVVASGVPFHRAVETPTAKSDPWIVRLRSPPPAAAVAGVTAARVGAALGGMTGGATGGRGR